MPSLAWYRASLCPSCHSLRMACFLAGFSREQRSGMQALHCPRAGCPRPGLWSVTAESCAFPTVCGRSPVVPAAACGCSRLAQGQSCGGAPVASEDTPGSPSGSGRDSCLVLRLSTGDRCRRRGTVPIPSSSRHSGSLSCSSWMDTARQLVPHGSASRGVNQLSSGSGGVGRGLMAPVSPPWLTLRGNATGTLRPSRGRLLLQPSRGPTSSTTLGSARTKE